MMTQLPALQVVIPLFAALLCAFMKRGTVAWAMSLIASWAVLVVSILILQQVLESGPISYAMGGWEPPWGIEYYVDKLNAFVLLLVSGVGAIIMPFAKRSVGTEIHSTRQPYFYTMYLLCLCGLLGIAITGDAFNIFVFLEVSSLATYAMVAMGKDKRALLAAFQYLIIGTIGATFYVIGTGLLYTVTGSLNLVDIAGQLDSVNNTRALVTALAFLTVGISLKLALFPLHVWLPNAYAYAPSFATVFLAATATKVAIYLLIRFFYSVFGAGLVFKTLPVSEILLILSVAAMFGASIVAIFQEDIKRMLAYSSVAQIGYITLGIALANSNGLSGGIVHIFNHAIMKAAFFLVLGAVFYRIGSVHIDQLAGIGRRMPVTMMGFVIAGMSIVGVPGTVGFVSKWYLAAGAFENGQWWLVFAIMISSLLAVIYVGRVVEVAWFKDPSGATLEARDPPPAMLVPILIFCAASIYFGIDTTLTAGIASQAAELLLGGLR